MRNLKKVLALVLALVMSLSLVTIANAADFSDSADINYDEAVDVMVAAGIIDGVGNNSFDPNGTLTREQAAKLITYMLLGENSDKLGVESTSFKDVAATRWSAPAIEYCASLGIIDGAGDGNFYPAGKLTGFAFAKMLLTAIGYDSQIEKYVGNSWTINVASKGMEVGLDNGLEKMFGSAEISRQDAAQMALNAIKTPLVEYNKQASITVNGAEVTVGTATAQYVTTTIAKQQNISNDKLTNSSETTPKYLVEFGEKYLPKLRLVGGTDDFERPANIWYWDGEKIGTYENDPDLTYTAGVKAGDIYKDLNLGETLKAEQVSIYVDGVEDNTNAPAIAIKKGSDTSIGGTANGVLTQVYYDKGDGVRKPSIIITEVNTWYGEVIRTVAATAKRDAYIEIDVAADSAPNPAGTVSPEKFETDASYADEAKVLYTFSQKADEIKSVKVVDGITGTVTQVIHKATTADDKVTMDGQEYKSSKNLVLGRLNSNSVGLDYTLYLDEYGYVIHASEEEYKDYALVLKTEGTPNSSVGSAIKSNQAKLVFTDGSTAVVTTDKDYESVGSNQITPGTIVTYKKLDDGSYKLKKVTDTSGAPATKVNTGDEDDFEIKNSIAKIKIDGATKDVYANSKTLFAVYSVSDDDWTAYAGIKAAPSIKAKEIPGKGSGGIDHADEKVTVYYYCKGASTATMTTVMFIVPGSEDLVENSSNSMLFLAQESVSEKVSNADGDYFVFQGIVNGEIRDDIKVADDVVFTTSNATGSDNGLSAGTLNAATWEAQKLDGMFSKFGTDKRGVITSLTRYDGSADDADNYYAMGIGSKRISGTYTVIVNGGSQSSINGGHTVAGAAATVTLADDCKYYSVDKDGNVSTSTINVVNENNYNHVYYIVKDGQVTYMVVETVEIKNSAASVGVVNITPADDPVTPAPGAKLTLTATPTGSGLKELSYQWYKHNASGLTASNVDSSADTKLVGETSKTLEVDTSVAGEDTYYYCLVTNTDDSKDISTSVALGEKHVTVGADTSNQMTVYVTFKAGGTVVGTENQEVTVTKNDKGAAFLTQAALVDEAGDSIIPEGFELDGTLNKMINTDPAQVDVPVKVKRVNMKLPEGYLYSWDAGTGFEKKNETAATTDAIAVPVGATVTVKVSGTDTEKYYVVKPGETDLTADASFLTKNGTFEKAVTAETEADDLDFSGISGAAVRYYKISVPQATSSAIDGVTYKTTAITDKYMKLQDTVNVAVTGENTATAGGDTATITVTTTSNSGTVVVEAGGTVTGPAGNGDSFAGSTLTLKLTAAPNDKTASVTLNIAE